MEDGLVLAYQAQDCDDPVFTEGLHRVLVQLVGDTMVGEQAARQALRDVCIPAQADWSAARDDGLDRVGG
jgi:hypothetical protein